MRRPDLAVSVAMLVVFGGMVVVALGYPAAARLLPLTIGVPALALTAWELRVQLRVPPAADPAAAAADAAHATERVAFLWLLGFVLAIVAAGFTIGGVAAVTVLQRFWLRESWRTSLIGGAVAFVVLFAGIDRGLQQPLFEGVVIGWARGWLGL